MSSSSDNTYDVIILGAGASGLFCAWQCAMRGRRVALVDHARRCGRKVGISGGGKCNFTNLHLTAADYLCANPHFVKSALAQFSPEDFLAWMRGHDLPVVDMGQGMLFSKSADRIVDCLVADAQQAGVAFHLSCRIDDARRIRGESGGEDSAAGEGFAVRLAELPDGRELRLRSASLVLACGGLAWPQIGASNLGYRLAKSFGLKTTPLRPGLVPLLAPADLQSFCTALSGISLPVRISGGLEAQGELLFTHKGISGPAVLNASLGWKDGAELAIDFLPGQNIREALDAWPRMELKNALSMLLPKRLSAELCQLRNWSGTIASLSKKKLMALEDTLHGFRFVPSGTAGYAKAEVTLGGVDTSRISSKTMEVKGVEGLFLTGELLDVTGRLGGFNLQWAWSSGFAAGQRA